MVTVAQSIKIQNELQKTILMQQTLFRNSGIYESIEMMRKIQSSMATSINTSGLLMARGQIIEVMKAMQPIINYRNDFQQITNSLRQISDTLSIVGKSIDYQVFRDIEQLGVIYQNIFKQFNNATYCNVYSNLKLINYNRIEITECDEELEISSDAIAEYENLNSAEKLEVDKIIEESCTLINKGDYNLAQRWLDWYDGLKLRHPINAYFIAKIADKLFDKIFELIIIYSIIAFASTGLVKIKEEPKATAPVIINIHIDNLTIVDDNSVKYYYKVNFINENGNLTEGFVSKKKISEIYRVYNSENANEFLVEEANTISIE